MKRKCIDLTGRKFGYYTVLEVVPRDVQAAFGYAANQTLWYCRCECNEISMVSAGNLLSGRSHGCNRCSAAGRWNGGNPWKAEKRQDTQESAQAVR